ncbi:hypothetical protein [Streptomyces microflavus]|uniref:hypothetical protein n=1 Tax=Streptomyces microflavus TaxID=1919 RepID=UPI00380F900F
MMVEVSVPPALFTLPSFPLSRITPKAVLTVFGRATEAVACWWEAAQIYTDNRLDVDANALHQHIRTAIAPNSSLPTPW